MTAIQIAWVAGILEGEGYFSFCKNGADYKRKRYLTSIITLKMTDKDVVERVAKLFGVAVIKADKPYSDSKQAWRCRAYGVRARGWMMTIYPLMSHRRQQKIREILLKENEYANS